MPGDFETVKERIDIVQLIGERVPLRKAGRAYKGLCPFHNEKTPSFTVDPDRRTYKCFGCLPPGSLIKSADGPRPIEEIRAGDAVYAADGRLHPVLLAHEHSFAGDLVKLTCSPFKIPILLTPNHRVPVLLPKSRRPVQVEAGAIRPQNYLIYPFIQRTRGTLDWSALPSWFGTRGIRPKPLPRGVDVALFAEWLGWYLAEGSVSNDRTVRFSLGGDESGIADRLRELTQLLFAERLRIEHLGSRIELWFCHALLARWLKHHCGNGAANKRLPSFVWSWTAQQQWTLFRALLLGDGSIGRGGHVARYGFVAQPSWRIGLVSPTLIDDVRDLLIRNGVVPSVTEYRNLDGRMHWTITVTADAQQRWGSGERPPWATVPVRVRKVDSVTYDGPVYNLTIDQEHTYLTMSGAVCNCGEGGDAFTWLEKQDGLEPAEALRVLAERAGVELTRRLPEEREGEKRLLAVHDTAHFYFRQAYRGTEAGHAAAAYLAGRGIKAETVEKFGLGYAPELRDGLLGYLRKKGFSEDEAVTSGLVVRNERGQIDRFRDRIMIPLRDRKGRIVAFAGRAMRADQPGKYVNSPQTPLFTKSGLLFALDVALPSMRRKGEAVIVEGQLDAISCHQAGFDNVVASMGTALTEDQYGILRQLKIERAIVAFDGDAAGTASAEKRGRDLVHLMQHFAATLANRSGGVSTTREVRLYVAELPNGVDPDQLARTDPDRLRTILRPSAPENPEGARPLLEFVIDQVVERMLEGAGDQLPIQIDRQQLQPLVNRFESCHPDHLLVSRYGRSIPRLAEDLEVFLQPQRWT